MAEDKRMPAWLICDAIIAKAREELLSQAISEMHEELDNKRIKLEGELPKLAEGEGEKERERFLLSQLVGRHEEIEREFRSYIDGAGKERGQNVEELEKFLLAVRQIVILYDYSKECEAWLAEVEKELRNTSPESIFVKTIGKNAGMRRDIFDYLLKNNQVVRERIFSEEERGIMGRALAEAK